MESIAGIVFDLDGTLVSSSLQFKAIKAEIGCAPDDDALVYIANLPTEAARDKAMAVIRHHEMQDALNSEWLPGAQAFVERCFDAQIPMAIMTRNSRIAAAAKIQQNQIPIDHIISRDDAPAKPNPAGLLAISAQMQVQPEKLLVVGDYKYDLQVARNAGAKACLVNTDLTDEFAELTDFYFPSMAQLHQRFFATDTEKIQ